MSSSQQEVHTSTDNHWTFDVPPLHIRGSKMQLLTIGCVSVIGKWQGHLGQYYVGYAPLLRIPKDAKIPPTVYNGVR